MKEDGVTLLSITSHLGAKSTSLAKNRYPNTANWFREYDRINASDGFHAVGETLGGTGTVDTPITAAAAAAGGSAYRIWDSDRLTPSTDKPFTQGTFGLEVSWDGELITTNSSSAPERIQVGCAVLDHAGNVMSSQIISVNPTTVTVSEGFAANVNFEFPRQDRPIARSFIYIAETSIAALQLPTASAVTNGKASGLQAVRVRGLESTGDLPDRDLSVVVMEGVNSGAAITINCGIVVSGIPAADHTFISGGASDTFVDDALVQHYLRTALKGVPRANLHSEIGEIAEVVQHIMSEQDHSEMFHAWSFGSIGRAFRHVGNTVRAGVRGFDKILTKALPMVKRVGDFASRYGHQVPFVGDAVSTAGNIMQRGAAFGDRVHQVTQYAASPGGVHDTRTGRMIKHAGKMY
jgi:hypothetical protein